jgi:serine/threonine-protein kinase
MVGRGAMATVWVARDLRVGDCVAVKLLASSLLGDTEARQRFQREGETASRLRSKFVVRLFDYGETATGVPYLVMELLHGLTLEAYSRRVGRMPMRHAVRFSVQISRGIAHAHRRGIIHRNLRPANIFLHSESSASPDEVILKILDFGVAKVQDTAVDSAGPVASRPGIVVGTPLFMAPEQLGGVGTIDHRVDLYSIGMLAFTLLTGKPAFDPENVGDLLSAILTKPPVRVTSLGPDLPASLDAWFERACARNPDDRFARANDLAIALHQAAGFEGPLDIHLEPGHAPVLPETKILELEASSEIPTQRWIPPVED